MAQINTVVDINLNNNQLLNAVLQNLEVAPSTVGLKMGFIYFNTTHKSVEIWDGTAWIIMTQQSTLHK